MPDPTVAAPADVLRDVFGYDTFRPYQEDVIDRVVAGRNALVVMPTGGGKSLCYQIPALLREGTALVVSPLIALMQDQVTALQQRGVRAAFLNSSLAPEEKSDVRRQLQAGQLDLLYVAPERLVTDRFRRLLAHTPLALIAIDEVHCMSQWGHDFRPDYLEMARLREWFPTTPCIAATATADVETQRDLLRLLRFEEDSLFVAGFDRPNIRYTVTLKRKAKKQLHRFIQSEHSGDSGIVYCLSRKKVEQVATWLTRQGHDALPYHAGLSDRERHEHQHRFLREDGLIIVATVAFGMGIDKPDVRFVAHLDLPKNLEAYYQETGRAGRDGQPADAWMLYRYADVVRLRKLMETGEARTEHDWKLQHKLSAFIGYCETTACRRRVLLNYFGDEHPGRCGNCDTCLHPVETWDGTVAAQKMLSCVARTGQRFGAGHVIDVLMGGDTEKVRRFGHDRLSTYGIGADLGRTRWKSVARQLVAANLLRVDVDGYGALQLTEACAPVLRGAQRVELRKDPRPKTATANRSAPEALPDTPEAHALFEALREKRLALAREQDVPPYVVFHDRTLRAMVQHHPTTPDAFGRLPGVGAVKKERYGPAFLDLLRAH